ncbi:MAG: hypothetical protein K6E62_10800 [Lachnospiraceae bacterium]|nr:hypothetical protein [Lachnospiraceae bacterium]
MFFGTQRRHKDGYEWGYYQYRLKENKKYVGNTTCPKCSMEVIVLEHVFEGISVDDDRIEMAAERGIWTVNGNGEEAISVSNGG